MSLEDEARPEQGLTLTELAREIPGARVVEDAAGVRITGVQHDSRRVGPGDLFVARRGATHDGRAFVSAAIAKGAVAVLADDDLTVDAPLVRVDDAAKGLAYAAAAVYGHPAFSLDVVGVTGTNGKTTTTHLVSAAIDGALGVPSCGVVGTIGHKFGGRTLDTAHTTPEADELARVLAVMKRRGATYIAMEVSSHALVLGRVDAVRFRVAAFTNLTQDHLDFHGTMEEYAAAKKKLFTSLGPGLAVINVDDPFGAELARTTRCKTLRVRTREGASDAEVYPVKISATAAGTTVDAFVDGRRVEAKTRLVGEHNVENLLVTLGVVSALELEIERAAEALANELGAPGRLERCDGPDDDIVVLVDYAHTPDALARVLDAVRAVSAGKLICVFGCGGDRDPKKRGPMGEAAGKRADLAVVTSDNPRTEDPASIAKPVEEGARGAARAEVIVELDRRKAIALAIERAAPGDVVLVAGKGHEDYQIVGKEKRPFDDRVEARAALARRRGATAASPNARR